MRKSAHLGAKNFRFFKIYGVSAQTRERVSQCGHFTDKGDFHGRFLTRHHTTVTRTTIFHNSISIAQLRLVNDMLVPIVVMFRYPTKKDFSCF